MDIRLLKGIGDKRAGLFQKLGLFTCLDLCGYYPRRYEDRTVFKPIAETLPGESVGIRATVAQPVSHARIRRGLELGKTSAFDESGTVELIFFNAPYVQRTLKQGKTYSFFGKITLANGRREMTNPIFEPEEQAGNTTGRILPLYRLTEGLSQGMLRAAVRQALEHVKEIEEPVPEALRARFGLAGREEAIRSIHFPESGEMLEKARYRLVFEELFIWQLGLLRVKNAKKKEEGPPFTKMELGEFTALLPYELTEGQKKAISDIKKDLESGHALNRLIQGDVGSGKTAVAAASAALAAENGWQAALMAPTEILAEQHYKSLSPLLEKLGIPCLLLTGSVTQAKKRKLYAELESGRPLLAVGTHALLSGGAVFGRLGLVITDEQHRFGVKQREALSGKGDNPHRLVLSATPIPRTLGMIMYGDLDVSVIRDLPPGRSPVETYVVGENMRPRIEKFIRSQIEEGRQAYVVCPLVEEDETEDGGVLTSAEEYARRLGGEIFPEYKVGLLHGKQKAAVKEAAMRDFAEGKTHILVTTTVVEVGVNVPNATLMVVENADRFGLSQLHQLRGRVGRGTAKSYCVLFLQSGGAAAKTRLEALKNTTDGFEIAEADLALRGPGDFFGSRQHGLPEFKLADISCDMALLERARQAATELLSADPGLSLPENKGLSELTKALLGSMGSG